MREYERENLIVFAEECELNLYHYQIFKDGQEGLKLWEGGIVMVRYLLENWAHYGGKSVLDVGAGMGVVGISAAAFLDSDVLMIDYSEEVIELCQKNIEVNIDLYEKDRIPKIQFLDWNRPDNFDFDQHYDVVIGCELVYSITNSVNLVNFLSRILKEGTELLMIIPTTRDYGPQFMETLKKLATDVSIEEKILDSPAYKRSPVPEGEIDDFYPLQELTFRLVRVVRGDLAMILPEDVPAENNANKEMVEGVDAPKVKEDQKLVEELNQDKVQEIAQDRNFSDKQKGEKIGEKQSKLEDQVENSNKTHEKEKVEKKRIAEDEAERKRIAKEADKLRIAEEEAEKKRLAEDEAEKLRIAEEEAEIKRLAEEADKLRIAEEEAEKKRIAEEEAEIKRLAKEAEKLRIAEEEAEKKRIAEGEAEMKRIAEEEADKLRIAEEEAEKKRLAEEAEKLRIAEEVKKKRIAEEEAEMKRIAEEEAEKLRIAEEEAERKRIAEEQAEMKRIAEEAEQLRIAEEEAEKNRIAEEEAKKKSIAEKESLKKIIIEEEAENKLLKTAETATIEENMTTNQDDDQEINEKKNDDDPEKKKKNKKKKNKKQNEEPSEN